MNSRKMKNAKNKEKTLTIVAAATIVMTTMLITTTTTYAQQQAPESEKSQGQGQGPPFNQGICITTGNLNPTVTPKSEQAREVCNEPRQV